MDVFRFAPSPNGRLHLGHAYSALLNDQLAAHTGGRFLLRIEDIDFTRTREEYVEGIFEDLDWLGLRWETPVCRQSDYMHLYAQALKRLRERGLVYPCYASRKDIEAEVQRRLEVMAKETMAKEEKGRAPSWPQTPDGGVLYPGIYRKASAAQLQERLASGVPCAWRLDMEAALDAVEARTGRRRLPGRFFAPERYRRPADCGTATQHRQLDPAPWGDVVLARRDIGTSYHMAVVVDDARQGITHVVRGQDLEAATSIHVLLQFLLELPAPLYHHHPLITTPSGFKLSKSRQDRSLADIRSEGVPTQQVRAMLGF